MILIQVFPMMQICVMNLCFQYYITVFYRNIELCAANRPQQKQIDQRRKKTASYTECQCWQSMWIILGVCCVSGERVTVHTV